LDLYALLGCLNARVEFELGVSARSPTCNWCVGDKARIGNTFHDHRAVAAAFVAIPVAVEAAVSPKAVCSV
jgi:hypothetical protein